MSFHWLARADSPLSFRPARQPVVPGNVHVLLEHSNRGKKSLGLDLEVRGVVD